MPDMLRQASSAQKNLLYLWPSWTSFHKIIDIVQLSGTWKASHTKFMPCFRAQRKFFIHVQSCSQKCCGHPYSASSLERPLLCIYNILAFSQTKPYIIHSYYLPLCRYHSQEQEILVYKRLQDTYSIHANTLTPFFCDIISVSCRNQTLYYY